ncbi:hypothetical protein HK096_006762, partial [Nowakowskiella sp. JEL0078]
MSTFESMPDSDINIRNERGLTPLHQAVQAAGPIETVVSNVQYLLSHNANISLATPTNKLPLILAWENGNREAYRLILNYAQTHNLLTDISTSCLLTPLHIAVSLDNEYLVKEILSSGIISVDSRDACDATPLHHAASAGNTNVCELLLNHGADVDAKDGAGRTPLYITAGEGRYEVTKLLVSRGGNIALSRNDGGFPIGCAALNGHGEVLKLMIENSKDVDLNASVCGCGAASLHHAPTVEVAKILLDYGADVNASRNYRTPLCEAIEHDREDVAIFLLENGANPNQNGIFSTRPLGLAIRKNQLRGVKKLLEHGAMVDDKEFPPLEIVCEYNIQSLYEMVLVLLDAGAIPTRDSYLKLMRVLTEDRSKVFLKMFEKSSFSAKHAGWVAAVKSCETKILVEILRRYFGFQTSIHFSLKNTNDRLQWDSADPDEDTGVWIPPQKIKSIYEKIAWSYHFSIIFRWITRENSTLKAYLPAELFKEIEQ